MLPQICRAPRELWCVVLAAGGSRRLGRPKQLVRQRGRPLTVRAACAGACVAPGRTVVVLGAHALAVRLALRRSRVHVRCVHNPHWQTGMASSLAAGLAALPTSARAALVMLADQPRVDAAVLGRLVRAWRARPRYAAAAAYAGRSGAPAVLPRGLWRTLAVGGADAGARTLLRGARRVTRVPMPEAEVDIDTPADLARLAAGRAPPRRTA